MRARHPYPYHFTASGIVLHDSHVLLVFHKRLDAWVPPGGHCETNELPEETAVREILEETGVRVEIVGEPMPQGDDPDVFFLTRPAYIQCVSAIERAGSFYHVDLAYACKPVDPPATGMPALQSNHEVKDARWVALDELANLKLAKNVAEGVHHTLGVLARQLPSPPRSINNMN